MEFTVTQADEGPVIALRGNFTFQDHHGFRAVLDALTVRSGGRKILDLQQVHFLDSAALGMLLIAEDEVTRRSGALILRNPSSQITRLFELSAMDSLLKIERSPDSPTADSTTESLAAPA